MENMFLVGLPWDLIPLDLDFTLEGANRRHFNDSAGNRKVLIGLERSL